MSGRSVADMPEPLADVIRIDGAKSSRGKDRCPPKADVIRTSNRVLSLNFRRRGKPDVLCWVRDLSEPEPEKTSATAAS